MKMEHAKTGARAKELSISSHKIVGAIKQKQSISDFR